MPHFDILEFCKQVDIELWNAYHQRQNITGRLVFPRYRNGEIRASEQEARFVFIEVMCRETAFRYSVETPTSNLYKFTGRTKESARTDMTLFDAQGSPICNIEFKSKGISLDAKEKSKIGKDLQKLIREPLQGLWFHLLESANSATVSNLLRVMAEQIVKVKKEFPNVDSSSLMFHICILKQQFSLQKAMSVPAIMSMNDAKLCEHFRVDLKMSRSELLKEHDLKEWRSHRLKHRELG